MIPGLTVALLETAAVLIWVPGWDASAHVVAGGCQTSALVGQTILRFGTSD